MPITPVWLTGYEEGVANASTLGGAIAYATGTAPAPCIIVSGTIAHSGDYCLKAVNTGVSGTNFISQDLPGTPTLVVGRFYFMWTILPSSPVTINRTYISVGSTPRIKFDPSDKKIYPQHVGAGTKVNLALASGTWYRVDFRAECLSGTNWCEVMVDGVTGGWSTYDQDGSYFTGVNAGWSDILATGTGYWDDYV